MLPVSLAPTAGATASAPADAAGEAVFVTREPGPDGEGSHLVLHTPLNVRSASLVVIAVLGSVFMLRWAGAVFIPLLLALLTTYALSPPVDWLFHHKVPRVLSASVLLLGILGSVGFTAYWLADDATDLLNSLPVAAAKLRDSMREHDAKGPTALDTVQQAATQIELATNPEKPVLAARGVTRVVVEKAPFNIRDYVWKGTIGIATLSAQLTVVLFLTFFALCAGDTFRRKMVKITGPTLTKKRVTVEVLNEITTQIQRYLLVQVLISVLVGIATWLAFWWLGLEYSAVWGIAAGILNLVPYLGTILVTVAAALVAFLQFGTPQMAFLIAGSSLGIHILTGQLLAPWLTSKASSMNPVAVFASVLAWGWLWGAWGLLLGIPIMMVIKAVCDRVEDLQPIGELMGS